ncbi:MAG TPA: 5'-3' exonuclease H3TH domain-containing protein [Candidatus Saccharimonadales bacterium]|nr:5'-3' exonuclease H3TH domain-containing protein [Candidatus Saccharimonadales bacterium]
MTKLVLIDGNAILHRAYHALPHSLTTKKGEPINAVYGFVSMLVRIVEDLKPSHLAVCFDTPKETFRKAEYVGYQANRPRLESDLSSQFEIAYKVLNAMNIPIYKLERYEADDVLGTIAEQTQKIVDEVIVVTGDRDILQLVNDKDKVKVYMPIKGLSNAKLYSEKDVIERMGVAADKITDFKGLAGDPSDNYPGVTGIGPKTAINLIEKYGSVEDIYKHLGDIPERVSKKLAIGAESAGISKKLATIVKDVPITFDLDGASKWNMGSEETIKYFKELGFKTLTNRVEQMSLI